MPTAQKYGGRKVATEPLPDVRRTAAETNLSTGVGVEQAKIEGARAIGQSGQAALGLSQQFTQVALEERQKAILADNFANDNKLALWTNKAQTAAFEVQGKDAMPLPETVGGAYEKYADTIAAGIKTKEGREVFAKQRAQRGTDLDLQLRRHVSQEMQTYYQEELKGVVANGTNEAISLAYSPDLVDKKLVEIISALKVGGPKLVGMGPEALKTAIGAATTAVHVGVITRLLAEGEDRKADAYFQHNKAAITSGDELAKIETKLEVGTTEGLGLRTAEDLWAKHGPKATDDKAPINLDVMETEARATFKDNPKALKSTIANLRERASGVQAGRQDRKEAIQGDLWGLVAQGATLKDILRSDAYLSAPGALQTQVKEHVLQEAQQAADRGYMLGQRGFAEAQRQEQEKENAGWAMLWHYDTPGILSQMTDNQVLALTPSIGRDHVNRLMEKKRALLKSDETVRLATIDDEDFKATAFQAGLKAYATGADVTDDDKAGLGRLRQVVETQINREQVATGKTLPRERRLAIMQAAVDQKVMVDKNYIFANPSQVAASVVNAKDRSRAYVPLAQVPTDVQTEAFNYIRGQSPAFLRMPEAEFRARMIDRVQKAYALRLMGASATAIAQALKGETVEE